MTKKALRLAAILFALALFASACGSDSSSAAVEDATEEPAASGGDEAIAALEAEWASARAALVEDIKSNGYGVDGDTLNGPGGWTVDLSACPSDWSDDAGIADGVITIGHTTAQSGALASYGNIGVGMGASTLASRI